MSPRLPQLTRREIDAVVDKLIAAMIDQHHADDVDAWLDFVLRQKAGPAMCRRIKRRFRERVARYRSKKINL